MKSLKEVLEEGSFAFTFVHVVSTLSYTSIVPKLSSQPRFAV